LTDRVLIISEKPTAARRIAEALDDDGAPEGFRERGVPYYVARKGKQDLIVVSALGHLYSIAQKEGKWKYPVYEYQWVPAYAADKRLSRTRGFIEVIEKLSLGIGSFVSACDLDMEGSLIAYMILLKACGQGSLGRSRRMRYSTLTDGDLRRAWDEMSDGLDYELIHAGRARHEVDWLFGINLSRALTLSVKNATGRYRTLSTGRVQGPALNFIKEREVEIGTFVPKPYWTISAETRINRNKYPLEYESPRLQSLEEAEIVVKEIDGKSGAISSIKREEQRQPPYPPFSLGDLQREAYYKLRYSPRTTLQAAERLYLAALISYPRTSSQRLPLGVDLKGILEGLKRQKDYRDLVGRLLSRPSLKPRQGKKDDPAHPAIHPTGKKPESLAKVDGKIYDLVCRRFMASMAEPLVRSSVKANVDVNGHGFRLEGSSIIEPGWTEYYGPYFKEKGKPLPAIEEGKKLRIRARSERKHTKPPARYNPGSMLKLMEDEGLGTKATRTDILDTLYKRGYVEGGGIRITGLGLTIVETLQELVPGILSVEMTKDLEGDLGLVLSGERDADDVVERAVQLLEPILGEFKEKEALIGAEIDEALRREAYSKSTLGMCPSCRTGELRIFTNKKTGKRFAGCSNYFEDSCDTSYPLPQRGDIQTTRKSCPHCGTPIVKVVRRRRRPWVLCINMDCPGENKGSEANG